MQNSLAWIALVAVAMAHLLSIVATAVNLPFMDEWEALQPAGMTGAFNLEWILRPHNEHRIVPTKLLTWLLYRANAWHHVANVVFNFCLYLVELAAFIWMLRATIPENRRSHSASLSKTEFIWCLLGLSGLAWENHSWGFQSQFHFFLLFYFLAIGLATRNDRLFWLTGVTAIASAYSFSSGVLCALAVAGLILLRAFSGTTPWRHSVVQITIIIAGIIAWGTGFQKNPGHPAYAWPWTKPFWDHYLSMLGGGWAMPGALKTPFACLVLTLLAGHFAIAIPSAVKRGHTRQFQGLISIGFAVGGLLATAAVTSLARAGLGVEQAASSRYTEFTFFILPLAWTALTKYQGLAPEAFFGKRQGSVIKMFFAIFILWCFVPMFQFSKIYQPHKEQMQIGRECVAKVFSGELPESQICETIYIAPIKPLLDRAVELNLAFTADYRINRGGTP
jgi:hypothetical protein